jgi:hypothetical protein
MAWPAKMTAARIRAHTLNGHPNKTTIVAFELISS